MELIEPSHSLTPETMALQSILLHCSCSCCAFNNGNLCFSQKCTSACRLCIEQIADVVEEEEDELTRAARLTSHAEASSSDSKVVLPSLILNTFHPCVLHVKVSEYVQTV